MASRPRTNRWAIVTVGLLGLAILASGCGKVNCDTLCGRVKSCRGEVTRALVERLPAKSAFGQTLRQKVEADVAPRVFTSCPERCDKLGRQRKWSKKLRPCLARKGCTAFAACVAPFLEP